MGRVAGVKAEETRARILDAATRLFAERGFDGVRTRDLASASGANVATVAYHFGDKRGLYDAVVDQLYEGLGAFGAQLSLSGSDPLAALVDAGWHFANANRDALRVIHRLLLETGGVDPRVADEWLGGRVDLYTERLVEWFGLEPDHARSSLLSIQYLMARWVLSGPEERCRLWRTDDPVEADRRLLAHLTDVARRLLLPSEAVALA